MPDPIDAPPALAFPAFVGGRLDRADPIRADPVERDGHLLMTPMPGDARAADHVLLGLDDSGPVFASLAQPLGDHGPPTPRSRGLAALVPADEVALYGAARSLVHWHGRHPFCSMCGAGTLPAKAGWSRRCGGCGAEHFPRVDPVVIMLAEHEGRVLLGRQHGWPEGRYSALAGFVEPGETIEEAVAREVKEEAGVTVHDVRYVMSQPWPFPSSLMIGCLAQARDDRLQLDLTELEHGMWCDADGVRRALAGTADAPFLAPPSMAVAWHLLDHWLRNRP